MTQDYEQLKKRLALNIKIARKTAKMSQEALALNADVDRTYVSQLERGIANPSLLILCRLADILQVDILDLLARSTDMASHEGDSSI
ncbi:helix-turn-helix transcriptional regulator (plasmid) [Deefgea piscis]|uniref:Helix-turn-helix transcriptional regulator n=1 Tax=Deefgea piscis TaxID=2739061 RepID=A0A6M8T0Q6_9NEIS|nr:helix-turn-helix transcriptional regulator [Deefgea piscis]QKJ68259.1 helix-turn-helix transcriptional regulator [Deefgea piscis]